MLYLLNISSRRQQLLREKWQLLLFLIPEVGSQFVIKLFFTGNNSKFGVANINFSHFLRLSIVKNKKSNNVLPTIS